ncbi:MAG: hypothetical protein QOH88_1790 [Verrucomicrobiota bacterium]|jgi:hypothetical protein
MGLHLNFEFTAPAETDAHTLEAFLQSVQKEAQRMGFDPSTVLNVPFDTPERRAFASRLGGSLWIEDERLKAGVPREEHATRYDAHTGGCRVVSIRGVVLVVTEKGGAESSFGFMQYPNVVADRAGETLAETALEGRWYFRDFVSTPDPRYRRIVEMFREAGYAREVHDDYAAVA